MEELEIKGRMLVHRLAVAYHWKEMMASTVPEAFTLETVIATQEWVHLHRN